MIPGCRLGPRHLAALLVFGFFVSCGAAQGDVVLSLEDSGRTISLERGQILAVPLEMNSGVGFEWELRVPPDGGVLRLLSDEVEVDNPDVVGGGGVQTWRFEAVGGGPDCVRPRTPIPGRG